MPLPESCSENHTVPGNLFSLHSPFNDDARYSIVSGLDRDQPNGLCHTVARASRLRPMRKSPISVPCAVIERTAHTSYGLLDSGIRFPQRAEHGPAKQKARFSRLGQYGRGPVVDEPADIGVVARTHDDRKVRQLSA